MKHKAQKIKTETPKEKAVNTKRNTCGDLMAFVSSKEPLISSSGYGAAPCVVERAAATE